MMSNRDFESIKRWIGTAHFVISSICDRSTRVSSVRSAKAITWAERTDPATFLDLQLLNPIWIAALVSSIIRIVFPSYDFKSGYSLDRFILVHCNVFPYLKCVSYSCRLSAYKELWSTFWARGIWSLSAVCITFMKDFAASSADIKCSTWDIRKLSSSESSFSLIASCSSVTTVYGPSHSPILYWNFSLYIQAWFHLIGKFCFTCSAYYGAVPA